MGDQIFIAIDGDGIGQLAGRAALSDSIEQLQAVSDKIQAGNDVVANFVQSVGGQVVGMGGDELNAIIPTSALENLDMIRKDYQYVTGNTLTMGVGSKMSEANKALHVGKLRGKDQVLQYDPSVEAEWAKAQQDANDGTATGEAKKIGDAYMKTNTPATAPTDTVNDGCPACAELDNKELSHTDDCPYCQALDAQENADGTAGMGDDCEMCKELDAKGENDGCPLCQEMDAKKAAAPEAAVEEDSADHPDNCPECQKMFADAQAQEQAPPSEQGMESEQEILDAIDSAPSAGGPTPKEIAENTDDTQMPLGQAMDANRSVPENYGDAQENSETNQPGQEGADGVGGSSEDAPPIGGVLKDSLNNQADDIQRQKAIDLVGNALQGFKANKQVLEQIKGQSPEFYASNISMLKAMIELCKLLGLQPKQEQASYPTYGASSSCPSCGSQAPVGAAPTPPAQSAAPQEGAAQAPKI